MAGRVHRFESERRRRASGTSPSFDRPHAASGLTLPRRRRRGDGIPARLVWAVLIALVVLVASRPGPYGRDAIAGLFSSGPAPTHLVALAPAAPGFTPRSMPICGSEARINCVVDGDTLWLDGEKMRIEAIDAPEVRGKCPSETALAARATRRLAELVTSRRIEIDRNGADRYGRTLVALRVPSGDVGRILVREGLAQRWAGRKAEWCGATG